MRVFFWGGGIERGKFWNWSLEMKENFGTRPLAVASQWMVAVISWCVLDGHWHVLMGSGWLRIFPGGLGWLLIFPGGLQMLADTFLAASGHFGTLHP